jgi:small subunit ribosomal protein S17
MSSEAKTTEQVAARKGAWGHVVSISGNKTVSVEVQNLQKHPRYGKYIRRRTKLAVHDPQGLSKVGDLVEIIPCRRLSKSKTHRLVRVVQPATLEKA